MGSVALLNGDQLLAEFSLYNEFQTLMVKIPFSVFSLEVLITDIVRRYIANQYKTSLNSPVYEGSQLVNIDIINSTSDELKMLIPKALRQPRYIDHGPSAALLDAPMLGDACVGLLSTR